MASEKLTKDLIYQTEIWASMASFGTPWSATEEYQRLQWFEDFLRLNPAAADRTNRAGHLTGSALVIDPEFSRVLLTHHRKLNLWLQLGGHADGEWDLGTVATREVEEESGLRSYARLQFRLGGEASRFIPYDLDRHEIPANPKDPCHFHYDVRFLLVADPNQPITITDESHDVRWFTIPQARQLTSETSMHRQFDKVEFLRKHRTIIDIVSN
jgi:8-oxo-dGTP pyrophosphatase MutT (NUDIX family)